MSKPKKPIVKGSGRISVGGVGSPVGGTDNEPPAFCFKYTRGGYGIDSLISEQKVLLLDKMHRLTQLRWLGIKQSARTKSGTEIIARTSLRKPVPADITEDVDIIAFHLPGIFRMLGWRSERFFHVVWLDPKGELYDHG